jgi:hypothetical protein
MWKQVNAGNIIKVKVKFTIVQTVKAHSSTLSLTTPLEGGELSSPSPGCFTPGKESRYAF